MRGENTKCGEIFRSGPGKFIFSCAYCLKDFQSKSGALSHIENHFFTKETADPHAVDIKNEKCSRLTTSDSPVEEAVDKTLNLEFVSKQNDSAILKTESSSIQLENVPTIYPVPKEDEQEVKQEIGLYPADIADDGAIENVARKLSSKSKQKIGRWGPSYSRCLVECDICGNRMRKTSLLAHLQSHANLKQFVCLLCQRGYNTKQQLTKHSKIHSNFKKFSCEKCGWQFHDRANLIQHIRRHTGEKPYKCKICEKSFAQSNTAIVHMRTHTGEKPYKCTICDKTFNAQNILKRHVRRHTNEKTFKCNNCEKDFFCGTALRDHRRSQHTGERPYVCSICKYSFSRRGAYREHIILHTGEKPYKCRFCELTFAQGAGRRSHERAVHKDVADLVPSKIKSHVMLHIDATVTEGDDVGQ